MVNFTALPLNPYEPMGIVTIIIGVVLVVAAFYIFYKVVKDLVINAIVGGIGLVVLHFLVPFVGLEIPITLLTILIALVAGLPGLIILILLAVFGMMPAM